MREAAHMLGKAAPLVTQGDCVRTPYQPAMRDQSLDGVVGLIRPSRGLALRHIQHIP